MKKLVSLILALVLIVTCLSGLCFAADPIAEVTNGTETKTVDTLGALLAEVKEDGNTKIKLLADVTGHEQIAFEYACELDLNGFTLKTTKGNACNIGYYGGTANKHSVVKNGTIIAATMGIRHGVGSLEVRDCVIVSPTSVPVGLHETVGDYNAKNIIDNCVLISGGSGAFSFHLNGTAQNGLNMTITNTKLVQITKDKYPIFCRNNGKSTVTLGENVEVYSLGLVNHANVTLAGAELKAVEGTHTVEAAGTKYEGLKMWTTKVAEPEKPVAPAEPATPAAPVTPTVPTTPVPDAEVPKTGASVIALGVMAMISLTGAALTKKH